MKSLEDFINESGEWNPTLNSHKKAYNDLLKWYDKCIKSMDRDEVIDLLKTAVTNFEHDDFDNIK